MPDRVPCGSHRFLRVFLSSFFERCGDWHWGGWIPRQCISPPHHHLPCRGPQEVSGRLLVVRAVCVIHCSQAEFNVVVVRGSLSGVFAFDLPRAYPSPNPKPDATSGWGGAVGRDPECFPLRDRVMDGAPFGAASGGWKCDGGIFPTLTDGPRLEAAFHVCAQRELC